MRNQFDVKDSPREEYFTPALNAQLKNRLSQIADGHALGEINNLQNELHRAHYKRHDQARWSAFSVRNIPDDNGELREVTEMNESLAVKLDQQLTDEIQLYKTAHTVMKERISGIADANGWRDEEDFDAQVPNVFGNIVQEIREEHNMPASEPVVEGWDSAPGAPDFVKAEETPDPLEGEPIQVIDRPEVPADAPKSTLEVPDDEVSLGDLMGKIAEDNSD